MRPLTALLAAALALGPALACTQDVEDPPRDGDGAPAADAACPPELADPLVAWGRAGFSGAVVITDGGESTCELAVGLADQEAGRPNTVDTTFGIGSVSKAFTAAAVLDLVARGDLALDDRAGDHVEGLTGPVADATIEQLLLHTSGVTGSHGTDHEPLDRDEAVAALGDLEQTVPAGTELAYTNAAYTLLALVVEGVTGEDYRDHLVEAVLTVDDETLGGFWDGEPAAPGPRAVGYETDGQPSPVDGSFAGPHWALTGNGDLAMTAPELARWTHDLFTGGVIDPEAVALLEETGFAQEDGNTEVPGWVRFDEERFGEPVYGVAGGGGDLGHTAVTAWMPESERVVTLVSNTAEVTAEDVLAEIAGALATGDPLPTPDVPADVDAEELAAAEGSFVLDEGTGSVEVSATDDGLEATADGPDATAALFPPADEDDAAARQDHEEQVLALLAGETAEGREELELLEEDLGPVTDVAVVGTVIAHREMRTYVRLTADEEALAWYSVDDSGGIQAVEITDDLPTLALLSAGGGAFRATEGPDVTVVVTDDVLTVTGPDGVPATARRA